MKYLVLFVLMFSINSHAKKNCSALFQDPYSIHPVYATPELHKSGLIKPIEKQEVTLPDSPDWAKLFDQLKDPTKMSEGLKQKLVFARSALEVDIFVLNGSYYVEYVAYLKELEKKKKLNLIHVSEGYGDKGLITIKAKAKIIREVAAWEPNFRGFPQKIVQFLDLPDGDFSDLKRITPAVRNKFIEMNSTEELVVFFRVDGDKTTFDEIVKEISDLGVTITSSSHISEAQLRVVIPVDKQSGMINVRIKQFSLYQVLTLLPQITWVNYHRGMGFGL